MRNGYVIETLTSVDIQEILKLGGKVIDTKALLIEKSLGYHHLEKLKKNYLP